jgi:hypothetical protein
MGFDPNTVFEAAANGLGRHFGNRAHHIKLPAMIDAAQPAIFVSAKNQRGAAMRTRMINQPDAAFGIPEGHQIFT